jgi:hypothetical protein
LWKTSPPVTKPTPAPPAPPATDLFGWFHDFFASTTWAYIRNGGIFLLVVLWVGSVLWTLKDARRRIADPVLVAAATLVGAVPVLGTLVYLLVRPPEYVDDVDERRLEIDSLEAELAAFDLRCPGCTARVQPDFLLCPLCATRLKEACRACRAPLEPLWQICPACATPRRDAPPAAAPKPRRRARLKANARVALDAHLLDVAKDVAEEQAEAEPAPAPETV